MPTKKKVTAKRPRELELDMEKDTVRYAVFNAVVNHVMHGTGSSRWPDGSASLVVSFGTKRFKVSVSPMKTEGRA